MLIPEELCHYTKKDIALEKILFERKIKIGQIGFTNDPKESKWRPFAVISEENLETLGITIINDINSEFQRISREEWKVLCMTKHKPEQKYEEMMKNVVMHNFQKGFNRPRMWAQYAENHAGVCIIFDGTSLHANIELALKKCCKIFHGSVT